MAAAYGNHVQIAELLLKAGADPNAKDETVQSAYLIATSEVGDDPRLLRLTLRHGADVRSLDSWKGTGLIRAADRGFDTIITVLLETDVDIDHVNRIGYTALHEAVILGDGGAVAPAHGRRPGGRRRRPDHRGSERGHGSRRGPGPRLHQDRRAAELIALSGGPPRSRRGSRDPGRRPPPADAGSRSRSVVNARNIRLTVTSCAGRWRSRISSPPRIGPGRDHRQVRARSGVGRERLQPALLPHPTPEGGARDPSRGHLQHHLVADLPPLADPGLVDLQVDSGQVLTEEPVRELPAEPAAHRSRSSRWKAYTA